MFCGEAVSCCSVMMYLNIKGHLRDTAEVSERDIIFL